MSAPEVPRNVLLHGDSREVLKTLPDCSVDSLVTDPPAGIAFMAKEWDDPDAWKYPVSKHGFTDGGDRVPAPTIGSSSRNPNCRKCKRHKRGWKDVPGCECEKPDFDTLDNRLADRDTFIAFMRDILAESFRVLKPGAYGLIWAIPRTSHWTAKAIEEAGFEIHDCIYHCFGSGFPKSLNIGKAIDKRRADNDLIRPWLRSLGSREEIATASGVTPRQVDHWLGDNSPCPQTLTEDRFRKLCQHFGNTPPWADLMYEQVGALLGEVTHSRSGGEDFAKRPGSTGTPRTVALNAPATDDAKQWDGWGTSLKPAVEVWWLVRKPIGEPSDV